MWIDLAFNGLLLLVDLWVVWFVARRPGTRSLTLALMLLGLAVGIAAVAGMVAHQCIYTDGARFHFLALLAWGIFLHGGLVTAAVTVPLWKAGRIGLARACGALVVLLAIAGVDGFLIEPTWLEVTRYVVTSEKLDQRVRIVVISDFQADHLGDYERRVLRTALAEEPDLILLPGDYVQMEERAAYHAMCDELNRLLKEEGFDAPLGAVAVKGNVDWRGEWMRIFDGLNVVASDERTTTHVAGLVVSGLTFTESFTPSLSVEGREEFHVAVGHGPDFALGDVQADLLVAGHTHGGQVQIPFLGPPLTLSRIPRQWAAGRTELSGGRTLIVSRGTGMERFAAPRVRFLCRPEVVVIDLVPAADSER